MKRLLFLLCAACLVAACKTDGNYVPETGDGTFRLAVAGVTHGHLGEVARRVGRDG